MTNSPQFYYRNSWWAGKFEYPDNVPWDEKKGVLCAFLPYSCPRFLGRGRHEANAQIVDWRGKSNGGHIRGENYKAFPRFRLMDLAAVSLVSTPSSLTPFLLPF